MRQWCLFAIILIPLVSLITQAGVPRGAKPVLVIPVDTVTPKVTTDDVKKFIPLDIAPTGSVNMVANKIADKSLSYMLTDSPLREMAVMRSATELQEKIKADIVIPAQNAQETSHRFTMKYELFQSLAQLSYTGWWNAVVNYDAKNSITNISINDKILNNKEVFVTQKISSNESQSTMGLRWSW